MFISVLTTACYLSLFLASLIESTPSRLISLQCILIQPSTSSLGLPHSFFLSFKFPNQNTADISLLSYTCHMPCQSHPSWCGHPNNIWWGMQTNAMALSPSWNTDSSSATQEILLILLKPNAYYHVKNTQICPYPKPDQYSQFPIHFSITLPSKTMSSKSPLSTQVSPPKPCTQLSSLPCLPV